MIKVHYIVAITFIIRFRKHKKKGQLKIYQGPKLFIKDGKNCIVIYLKKEKKEKEKKRGATVQVLPTPTILFKTIN